MEWVFSVMLNLIHLQQVMLQIMFVDLRIINECSSLFFLNRKIKPKIAVAEIGVAEGYAAKEILPIIKEHKGI
jgi:hypothetical protein